MRSEYIRRISYLPLAALIFTGSLLLAAPSIQDGLAIVRSETSSSAVEARRLLGEVRVIANQLNSEAQTLESYAHQRLSWQSHADQLSLAKQHINAVGEKLVDLQAICATAAPWQQQAIDSIVPVAMQLANRTEAAILHLNENRGYLFHPVYTEHLNKIADHSDQMKESVNVFLELASTQEKLDNLREKVNSMES